ncbi:MAG TPA: hypothetical protein DCM26_00200 [Desulfotomaculum sp.]|nr:hypothetical protein [Desulfotomaculum sp.]
MIRSLRIEYPGAVYHVTVRGNAREPIFLDDEDRILFLLNPVRAKITCHPCHYRWSSYCATAGEDNPPDFLTVDWLLSQFGRDREQAQKAYRRFVEEGQGVSVPPPSSPSHKRR